MVGVGGVDSPMPYKYKIWEIEIVSSSVGVESNFVDKPVYDEG